MTKTYYVVFSDDQDIVATTYEAGFRAFDRMRRTTQGQVWLNEYSVTLDDLNAFICHGAAAFRDITPTQELNWRKPGVL
jgi:hypothetical protein